MNRKLFAALVIVGALTVGVATTSGAGTDNVTRGNCYHAIGTTGDTSFPPENAPGQTKPDGPLTIVDNPSGQFKVIIPHAFASASGCS